MSIGCIRVLIILFIIHCLYNLLIVIIQKLNVMTLNTCASIGSCNTISCGTISLYFYTLFICMLYMIGTICIITSVSIFYNHVCITMQALKYFKIFSLLSIVLMYYLFTSSVVNLYSSSYVQLIGFYLMSLVLFFINRPIAFIVILEICNLFIYMLLFAQHVNIFKIHSLNNGSLLRTTNIAYYFWASFFALISYVLSLFFLFYCFYTFNFSTILLLYSVLFTYMFIGYKVALLLFTCFFILFFCIKFGFTFFVVWKFKFFTVLDSTIFYAYYCYYMALLLFSFVNYYFKFLIIFLQIYKFIFFIIMLCNCLLLYKFWASVHNIYQFFVISSLVNLTVVFFYIWSSLGTVATLLI